MKNAILIHGWASKGEFYDPEYPTASNSHWFPWLTKQLMTRDIHTVALEMPNGYYPEYEVWKRELERFDISEETTLVGHSCGAGFIVRWLSEYPGRVAKVVLVAPWLGDEAGDDFDASFFEFEIDQNLGQKAQRIILINSTDDFDSVQKGTELLREKITDHKYIELENKGHFTLKSLGTQEFPELLEELIA